MLISIAKLKSWIGLPATTDAEKDPILKRSSVLAQALVDAYVKHPIERIEGQWTTIVDRGLGFRKLYRLPAFPVLFNTSSPVKIDGVEVPSSEYAADERLGTVEFTTERQIGTLEISYAAGFTAETLPADVESALVNIAIGIYNNGGNLATAGATGDLKSLTMFDALSMSFDVGANTADAFTPEGIVKQWAFVLDKLKHDNTYTMGQ